LSSNLRIFWGFASSSKNFASPFPMLVNAAEKARPAFLMLVDIVVVGSSSYFTDAAFTLPCGSKIGGDRCVASLPRPSFAAAALPSNTDRSRTTTLNRSIHQVSLCFALFSCTLPREWCHQLATRSTKTYFVFQAQTYFKHPKQFRGRLFNQTPTHYNSL
jgi:hypothetical protein